MIRPEILVITPTLGTRDTLIRTVESVRSIGKEKVKHILITPVEKVEYLQSSFPGLEVVAQPTPKSGIFISLNYVIKKYAPHYTYFTYINDDDFWYPKFNQLIELTKEHPEIDIYYGRVAFINGSGKKLSAQASSGRYQAFANLLDQGIILFTQQATICKLSLYTKLGGFDENFTLISDTDFWLRAIQSGADVRFNDAICAGYTIQRGQLTSNKQLQQQEHLLLNIKKERWFFLHSFYEKILFKTYNLPIYVCRIFTQRKLRMRNFYKESE